MKNYKKDVDKKLEELIQRSLDFTKLVNTPENLSSIGLTQEQVKKLAKYIINALKTGDCCSYRYLIYDVLDGVSYCDGMEMGLLDLNNALCQACDRRCKRRRYE